MQPSQLKLTAQRLAEAICRKFRLKHNGSRLMLASPVSLCVFQVVRSMASPAPPSVSRSCGETAIPPPRLSVSPASWCSGFGEFNSVGLKVDGKGRGRAEFGRQEPTQAPRRPHSSLCLMCDIFRAGQCLMCGGEEVITTSWMLRVKVDSCDDKWKSVYIGRNHFTRTEQKEGPRKRFGTHTPRGYSGLVRSRQNLHKLTASMNNSL